MRHTKATQNKVFALLNEGAPINAIARATGVTGTTIRKWRDEGGATTVQKPSPLRHEPNTDLLVTGLREQNARLKALVSDLYLKSLGIQ